ncbi:uncharacterized protein C9orf85 homolog [Tachypleus tridentatus]|uniref:uncharacterized protein C9orf85 homolog n=1 Tax=Tachypleus tridentatus TaxID=6853 RepID=UPI003FD3E9B7
MSTQRGNVSRTRSQKHQNSKSFKNNVHDNTNTIKTLNNKELTSVCARCRDVIVWKIKYKKYKPLTVPRKCTRCQQKSVKEAYHIVCTACVVSHKVCGKCGKEVELVERPKPSVAEQASQNSQFELEVQALSERKRRTLLRYLENSRAISRSEKNYSDNTSSDNSQQKIGCNITKDPTNNTDENLCIKTKFISINELSEPL